MLKEYFFDVFTGKKVDTLYQGELIHDPKAVYNPYTGLYNKSYWAHNKELYLNPPRKDHEENQARFHAIQSVLYTRYFPNKTHLRPGQFLHNLELLTSLHHGDFTVNDLDYIYELNDVNLVCERLYKQIVNFD